MLINIKFEKCILCCNQPTQSKEHIIPKCIEGNFQAMVLCKKCNEGISAKLMRKIREDSWFLSALKYLRNELPKLHQKTSGQYSNRDLVDVIIEGPNELCGPSAVLMAYEFLALLMRDSIYDKKLDCIREFIKNPDKVCDDIIVIPKIAVSRKIYPRHEISFLPQTEQLTILVKFFHVSGYEITFKKFFYKVPDIVFVEDVKQRKSLLAISHEEARKNNFMDAHSYFK